MGYTVDQLWEAVYGFIPSFKTARENGVYMNLPSCLNSAIVTSSIMEYEYKHFDTPLIQNFVEYHELLIRAARDLQNLSQFNFKE